MQRLGLVMAGAVVAAAGTAGDRASAQSAPKTTGLGYDVGAALVDIDALSRPGTASGAGAGTPRTIGLRYLTLGLAWQAPGGTGLRLVLRPDAVNRDEAGQSPAREFDDRSGDPGMQPMPTIRLADTYQLTYEPSPSLGGALGVFAGLTPSVAAYPEVLGFGLQPLFPAKFAGLRLGWRRASDAAPTETAAGAVERGSALSASVYLFQGSEERAETLAGSATTFDQGPTARDPYHGGALELAWAPSARFGVGLTGGTEATTAADEGAAAPAQPGQAVTSEPRHDAVFVRLTSTALFPVGGRDGKLGLDVRYLREAWTGGVADRHALAGMLTASLPASASVWGLLGAGYGKDDRWVWGDPTRSGTVPLTGYQLEAGVLGALSPELSVSFVASHEFRTIGNPAGGTSGGFFGDQGPGAPGTRSLLHRFGLQLTYRLDHQA